MKNPIIRLTRCALLFAASLALFLSCSRQDPSFAVSTIREVEQISNNRLGRLDPIVVRFTEPVLFPNALFDAVTFKPHIKGTWILRDDRTIEFTPASPYKSNGKFTLTVDSGVLKGKQANAEGFSVAFNVRPSEYEILPDGLYTDSESPDSFILSGILSTDIPIAPAKAKVMLQARLGKKNAEQNIEIEWVSKETTNAHRFIIQNIQRTDEDQLLVLSWKGVAIGSKYANEQTWLVPQKQDFKVLEIAANDPSCITVRFSDKLDPTQDIRGLIKSINSGSIRYNLDGNILKLYNIEGWKPDQEITILEGFKSESGKTLMTQAATRISSAWELPEVRFANDGVILPPTNGVIVTVETKNLKGIIVEAYKIYGDNVLQFLQVNELDGSREMRRVGEPIWSSAFDFNWDESMKNTFIPRGLDLGPLVKKNPGGIIQLRVTFRKRHVMYTCTVNHSDFSALPMPSDEITADKVRDESYWDYFNDMSWETRDTFWTYRKDPCHPAFYMTDYNNIILARKNVLISNLGIINKLDQDGTYHIAIADIGTAMPTQNAEVMLYSYAQKVITSGKTDKNGFVNLTPQDEPFFITATKDAQISYLRIEGGSALSVSHFEVEGEKAEKGVKGFLYGERGVWRPGDTIHLVFILQDLKKVIPTDFPITFELQDPRGRIAKTGVFNKGVDGFYRIDTSTAADDPTGPWIARINAGGQTWSKTLKVETVVPNRLSVNLKTSKPYLSARNNSFTLTGEWLHGAKAPGLKADVSIIFYPGTTSFDGYGEYTFINPERSVESNRETVWEGKLDAKSTANFNLDLNAGDALPGKLNAQLVTRIFEPSLMFSIEQVNYEFSPYERYVGIRLPKGDASRNMLLTDTKHRVDIAILSPEGKPVSDSVSVTVAVYKLDWRWWWEKEALTDASYVSGRSAQRVAYGEMNVKNGKGNWSFEIKYPEWGRYLVIAEDGQQGHSAAKIIYVDWPGWAGRGSEAGSGSAAMLTLTPDKTAYRVGENAIVSFPSGTGGRALVTVEKDGKILAQDWLDTVAGTTVYKLPLTAEMAPNAYVHITMLQKHMQSANSLPIRLYGVIPIMVENPQTRLVPVISSADRFEPGKKTTLTVTEASGRPMTYTVAVVDEGLLGLTRFTAANPWNSFYKKEASRLSSWDIYRYVLSAFGGKLETMLSIGGSEDALNANNKKAERFKAVVLFFGPFELPAKGTSNVEFEMPQYVGAVRIMVTAGKNGAYGTAEKTVQVKSDLMVQATLPRTLGANEIIEVPVTLFNGKDVAQEVTVDLDCGGVLTAHLMRVVEIPPLSDKTITFRMPTYSAGTGTVKVTAGEAVSITEIDVLQRGSPIANSVAFSIPAGSEYKVEIASPGEKGTKALSVELATLPALDLETRLKYLINYPHGCIEQITSGAFPQLFIADLIDTSSEDIEKIKGNVTSVIERYQRYQTASGGFAYWTGEKTASPWGTSWAGHFMIEARKAGYDIPEPMFKEWLSYQQEQARNWQPKNDVDDAIQAYRLYTLALAGYPDLGGMNRQKSQTKTTTKALWLLAGAYALSGHSDTALEMTKNLPLSSGQYRETGNTWGSNTRDSAIAINSLNVMGDAKRNAEMIPQIAETFGSGRWFSTQETTWMLLALLPYYRGNDPSPVPYAIRSDADETSGEIRRSSAIRKLKAVEAPLQKVAVSNKGNKILYGKIVTRGIIAAGKETKLEKGLGLTIQYFDQNDNALLPTALLPGMSFSIRVGVTNLTRTKVENIALTLLVPTCWEFSNERVGAPEIDSSANDSEESEDYDEGDVTTLVKEYDYRDIKDTSIETYFTLKPFEGKTFVFHATVAYNGTYYVPALHAEAMYNTEYQATLPGQLVTRISASYPQ